MKINGTYLDRLIWNVLPFTIFAGILLTITKGKTYIIIVVWLTSLIWLLDCLIIYFKFKPFALKYSIENGLSFNEKEINPDKIISITPITNKRLQWTFKMIKIALKDGETFFFIDKPKSIIKELKQEKSKSLKKLIELYPELVNKIKDEEVI